MAITHRNYTQYSVETNPPVSFVFEPVSDDSQASAAGAKILQVMTGGHSWQLESEICVNAISTGSRVHIKMCNLFDYTAYTIYYVL